jgi:hypothetical protein
MTVTKRPDASATTEVCSAHLDADADRIGPHLYGGTNDGEQPIYGFRFEELAYRCQTRTRFRIPYAHIEFVEKDRDRIPLQKPMGSKGWQLERRFKGYSREKQLELRRKKGTPPTER